MVNKINKVVRRRFAIVMVEADVEWLTCQGDCEEHESWPTIQADLESHLGNMYTRSSGAPTLKFIEWEEDDGPSN